MDYDYSDFTEDIEAHKRLSNLPRSCGWEVGSQNLKPGSLVSESISLISTIFCFVI